MTNPLPRVVKMFLNRADGTRVELAPDNVRKVLTAMEAVFTAPRVSDEVRTERERVCAACDKARPDQHGNRYCGCCGCALFGRVLNLTRYAENLPKWGCKHPQRAEGQGWPQ